jgi:GxxExxY protein
MTERQPFRHEEHEGHEAHEAHEDIGLERLAQIVVDSGFAVHKALGPGLLESTYEHCLVHELETRSVSSRRQLALPVSYKGVTLDAGYRIDLLVDGRIVVEIKTVEALTRLHEAQILTYLRLSGRRLGFLMNFNVPLFKHGLRRFAL